MLLSSCETLVFFSAKTLNDSCLPKLAHDEGTVVYDNEPGPDKYVSTLFWNSWFSLTWLMVFSQQEREKNLDKNRIYFSSLRIMLVLSTDY